MQDTGGKEKGWLGGLQGGPLHRSLNCCRWLDQPWAGSLRLRVLIRAQRCRHGLLASAVRRGGTKRVAFADHLPKHKPGLRVYAHHKQCLTERALVRERKTN